MSDATLGSGNIASTALTTTYTVPSGNSARVYSYILTNLTSNTITVSAYYNDLTSDRLLKTFKIPPGSGKTRAIFEALGSYTGGYILKLQASSADSFNYLITGRLS